MNLSPKTRRALIWTAYLLPLAVCLILLIWALIPHMFFIYGGDVKETMSLFELMRNTWAQCQKTLDGKTNGSSAAIYFSYAMTAAVVLSWAAIIAHVIASAVSAVCACVAFSRPATDPTANKAVRWTKFFCFHPAVYTLTSFAWCLPFFMPLLLDLFYRKWFYYDMSLHYFGPPSWIVAILLSLISAVVFVATRKLQRSEKMDLFCFHHED